jgi:multiple sugar transport system permease protein
VLIAPAIGYFAVFLLYPAVAALYCSFTEWNLRTDPACQRDLSFNRVRFLYFCQAVRVTLLYTLPAAPLTMVTPWRRAAPQPHPLGVPTCSSAAVPGRHH